MQAERLRDAIPSLLAAEGLSADAGQQGAFAWVQILPGLWVPSPNPSVRKRLLALHDAHHIVTGYPVTRQGEAEVSAWAVAAGGPWPAFAAAYDLLGMALGLLRFPQATLAAWQRGRGARRLYGQPLSILLESDLATVRALAGVDAAHPKPLRYSDVARTAVLLLTLPLTVVPLVLWGVVRPTV